MKYANKTIIEEIKIAFSSTNLLFVFFQISNHFPTFVLNF